MTRSSAPDPAQATAAPPAGIRTLVFDVLGTVIDEAGSIAAETAAALAAAGADPGRGPQLAEEWVRRLDAMISQVSALDAPWHSTTPCGGLSAELVKAYKPDPAVYRLALDLLGLNPRQAMMVAAHPWDLRSAAEHGMRSAYITRPGEGIPAADDSYDVYAKSLADLAELLAPGTG